MPDTARLRALSYAGRCSGNANAVPAASTTSFGTTFVVPLQKDFPRPPWRVELRRTRPAFAPSSYAGHGSGADSWREAFRNDFVDPLPILSARAMR
ncbi:MAG: hypothetical protein ACPG3X_08525, partial [Opitutales bacterium]